MGKGACQTHEVLIHRRPVHPRLSVLLHVSSSQWISFRFIWLCGLHAQSSTLDEGAASLTAVPTECVVVCEVAWLGSGWREATHQGIHPPIQVPLPMVGTRDPVILPLMNVSRPRVETSA